MNAPYVRESTPALAKRLDWSTLPEDDSYSPLNGISLGWTQPIETQPRDGDNANPVMMEPCFTAQKKRRTVRSSLTNLLRKKRKYLKMNFLGLVLTATLSLSNELL